MAVHSLYEGRREGHGDCIAFTPSPAFLHRPGRAGRYSPLSPAEINMHILPATLYGLSIWLPWILYTAATQGRVWLAVALGPLIVSGAAGALLLVEYAIHRACDRMERAEKDA